MFRHFKTLKEARAYIAEKDPHGFSGLTYKKKKGKAAGKPTLQFQRPYMVGTPLSFLHFT